MVSKISRLLMRIMSYSTPKPLMIILLGLSLYCMELTKAYLLVYMSTHVIWTFVEYIIHRFFFHYISSVISKAHAGHHRYPRDPLRFFLPLAVTIPNAISFYLLFYCFFGPKIAQYALSSGILHYLVFEICHSIAHSVLPYNTPIMMYHLAKFHRIHHVNHDKNYGFSTPFWDYLFGTRKYPKSYRGYKLRKWTLPIQLLSFQSSK
jgi:4-hydroxysphinganine ceramide fatty acyl 2-hydroxylase